MTVVITTTKLSESKSTTQMNFTPTVSLAMSTTADAVGRRLMTDAARMGGHGMPQEET